MKTFETLPQPIGSYTVGRTQMDFHYQASDESDRELTAYIYYPSDSHEGKPALDFMYPESHTMINELENMRAISEAEGFFPMGFGTWCYEDLALSAKENDYPVLFYVHGGAGFPELGTGICSDLASVGYIAVTIGHQDSGMYKCKDGRLFNVSKAFIDDMMAYATDPAIAQLAPQMMGGRLSNEEAAQISLNIFSVPSAVKFGKFAELQAEDVRYVADCLQQMNAGTGDSMFKGRLRLDAGMGVFGHSFGGPTACLVCRDDDRFTCGVSLDGGAYAILDSDIGKPYLNLCCEMNFNGNAIIGASNSQDTWFALVKDAVHYDFCDFAFTSTIELLKGPRDALEMRDITTSYTKTFFDKFILKNGAEVEDLSFDGIEVFKMSGKGKK